MIWTLFSIAALAVCVVQAGCVDTSSLDGKFVVGYQGWFRKPGEDDGNSHWTRSASAPQVGDVGVDFVPYVAEYPSNCLFDTPFTLPGQGVAQFYSSDCEGVIDLHFSMMKQNNIDGPFIQRFYGYIQDANGGWTNILEYAQAAAEKYGLGFAVEYDLTGAATSTSDIANTLLGDLEQGQQLGIFNETTYFHHGGKPVIEIWGLGIRVPDITVEDSIRIVNAVKNAGYYVVLGVQQAWRSELSDTTKTPYGQVYPLADTIQPWTVGSYDPSNYAGFYSGTQVPDSQQLAQMGIGSSIVAWPGASSINSQNNPDHTDTYARNNGTYYQAQLTNAVSLKPQFIFGAMFDEVNEGTAIMPVLRTSELPTNQFFRGIDDDQPHDYYLQKAGNASLALKQAKGV